MERVDHTITFRMRIKNSLQWPYHAPTHWSAYSWAPGSFCTAPGWIDYLAKRGHNRAAAFMNIAGRDETWERGGLILSTPPPIAHRTT
jgi:hypothetical protein